MAKVRTIRLKDDLWDRLKKRAKKEDKTISDVMREILIEEVL